MIDVTAPSMSREPSEPPTISVVIATLNAESTIRRCLDSCVAQNLKNIEIVVIDGASTDATVSIAKSYGTSIDIVLSREDSGVYEAFNEGIGVSSGTWICFLGADDYFASPESLSKLLASAGTSLSGFELIYGDVALVNELGEEVARLGTDWPTARERFDRNMAIPHVGLLHSRELFEKFGGFDEAFRIAGDYEFMLRVREQVSGQFFGDVLVACHSQGGLSTNIKSSRALLYEMREAKALHGVKPNWIVWNLSLVRINLRMFVGNVLGEHLTVSIVQLIKELKRQVFSPR